METKGISYPNRKQPKKEKRIKDVRSPSLINSELLNVILEGKFG